MNPEQIETSMRRAYSTMHNNSPEPTDDFADSFDAGLCFALSHQWISVEERLPEDDRYFYLVADARLDPLGVDCVEYTCETKQFSRYGKILHPTHWCAIPWFDPNKQ